MTKPKYTLTDEHRSRLKPWADQWIANAMSTKPMDDQDRHAMRDAVRGLYLAAGLTPPPDHRIVFVPSPFVLRFAGGFAAGIWHMRKTGTGNTAATDDATSAATRDATYDATYAATRAATHVATSAAATRDATYAATDAATRDATRAATYDATYAAASAATSAAATSAAATRDATYAATSAATRDATSAATSAATRAATDDATYAATDDATDDATYAATSAATDAATDAATRAATDAATDDATRDATSAATDAATDDATRAATYAAATRDATRAATDDATYAATSAATYAATSAATDDATYAATSAATDDATRDATDDATSAATYDATYAATYAATRDAEKLSAWFSVDIPGILRVAAGFQAPKFLLECARMAGRMWQGGNQWSAWAAFLSFFRHVAKLDLPQYEKWQHWEAATVHGGPRIMHPEFCMISDRPEVLLVDNRNRPHCDNGPFCKWRDGSALFAIHGVHVPGWIVMQPELITAAKINAEGNQEVRRIMIERFGHGRYIAESGAKELDRDWAGVLYEKRHADGERTLCVEVVNSTPEPDGTHKHYFLSVHPELRPMSRNHNGVVELGEPQKMTARNAVASTFGLRGEEYDPFNFDPMTGEVLAAQS